MLPLCDKICNLPSDQIPALFHRVPWAPLFYPETLLAFLQDSRPAFAKTSFHYPKAAHFSSLTNQLVSKIQNKKNIVILRNKITKIKAGNMFSISLDNSENVNSDKLVWAMDLARYVNAKDQTQPETFDKTSIAFLFFEIQTDSLKKKISTLYVLDTKYSIYRITNQTYCSGENTTHSKIVIEINYDYHKKNNVKCTETDLIAYSINALKELDIIDKDQAIINVAAKIILNALNLPTLKNFYKFESMYNKVVNEKQENLLLIGPSSGFSSSSLNDQIVQGLKIAALFN